MAATTSLLARIESILALVSEFEGPRRRDRGPFAYGVGEDGEVVASVANTTDAYVAHRGVRKEVGCHQS